MKGGGRRSDTAVPVNGGTTPVNGGGQPPPSCTWEEGAELMAHPAG